MTATRSKSTTCDALTAFGLPCRLHAVYVVELPGQPPLRFCGTHARTVPPGAEPRLPGDVPLAYPRPRWTAEEDAVLLAHAGESVSVVAELVGRSTWAVVQRRARLRRGEGTTTARSTTPRTAATERHGPRPIKGGEPWTVEEDDYLLEHPDATASVAAAHLGRTRAAVWQRRLRHRLEGRGNDV